MSYKCAIFGHKYGETEVEREREEDGKEVISTVREVETCTRCGETHVVSENKEVTTLETAADIVADDLGPGEGESSETESETAVDSPGEPSTDGESDVIEDAPEIPDAESGVPEEAVDPETDDAVILDDEEDEDQEDAREPGEWPEETTEEEQETEDIDWPEETVPDDTDDTPDWELPSDIDPHPETETAVSRPGGDALTVPEGEFYCQQCGFTTPVESSSLRAGDFCPECRKGALEHRRE